MADNLAVTPGTGASVAADDIGGVLYQRVKMSIGADGSATDLAFGQAVKTASLPVVIASDQGNLGVQGTPSAFTDRSGTITSGGTAQTLAAANASRKYILIINISDTIMWVNFGVTAVQDSPSIPLMPSTAAGAGDGGFVEYEGLVCPSGLASIIGPTTGKKFVAKEV